MMALPSAVTSRAPAPRSASVSRGNGSAATRRAVGWNCTNSSAAVRTPAAMAMASPSPVANGPLVVQANIWPMPPVASTVSRAPMTAWRPPSCAAWMPVTPSRGCVARCTARHPPMRSTCRASRTRRQSAATIARPLWSPSACTIRAREWPASRCRLWPAVPWSNCTPLASRKATASRADSTTLATACGSAEWHAAASVSATCSATESFGSSAAARPPCAIALEELLAGSSGQSSATRRGAADSAAHSPATPAPTTSTSVSTVRAPMPAPRAPACAPGAGVRVPRPAGRCGPRSLPCPVARRVPARASRASCCGRGCRAARTGCGVA